MNLNNRVLSNQLIHVFVQWINSEEKIVCTKWIIKYSIEGK